LGEGSLKGGGPSGGEQGDPEEEIKVLATQHMMRRITQEI